MIAQTQSRPARLHGFRLGPVRSPQVRAGDPGMSGGTVAWTFGRDRILTL